MSNFTRKIGDMEALQKQLTTDGFLQAINRELIQTGRAFLAFRNDLLQRKSALQFVWVPWV